MTYVTAGDPDRARSAEVLRALDRGGADVIEVGVPFSDPIADGPAIQRASERALAAGGSLAAALDLVRDVRPSVAAPIVLFTYVNPVLRMGVDRFMARAAERRRRRRAAARPADRGIRRHAGGRSTRHGLDQIFLVSPTTTTRGWRKPARLGRGFLYAISRLGVTGARDDRRRQRRAAGRAACAR